MTFQLHFQRALQTRSTRFANYYNQYGKPSRKKPGLPRPDWMVVFTFVIIALSILFG